MEEQCREKISGSGRYGSFNMRHCSKKVWKDGYCKVHHPSSAEERLHKSAMLWEEKMKKEPHFLLQKANERIIELENEIQLLKGKVNEKRSDDK